MLHRERVLVALTLALTLLVSADRPGAQATPGWLTRLNLFRATAALPPVTENLTYTDGDWKHARYIVKTDTLAHSEDPANPWYTPEGATAAANSNLAASSSSTMTEDATIDLWMQAPFHAVGMLDPKLRQVGYGLYHEADGGYQSGAGLDVLRGRGTVPAGVTYPIAWPGNGSSVPLREYRSESPDPLTSCPGYTAPAGLPILLQLGSGSVTPSVTASSFSSNGVALEHCVFHEGTYHNDDPSQQSLARSILASRDAIVLIPRAPLTAGATYDVAITTNGMTVPWSFSVNPLSGCSYGVSPMSVTAPAAGGTGSVTVTTATGCAWAAASNANWITMAANGGTSSGTVGYIVAPNSSTSARTGTMSVAGQTVTVTQAGVPPSCTLGAVPTSIDQGMATTLTWTSANATSLSIDHGMGAVTPVAGGSVMLSPPVTTLYTATATGPGGSATCAATVTVIPSSSTPSVWNSWDVVTQSGSPQGLVTAAATGATVTLEFYESTNNGGVLKGALFGVFTAGVHPGAFNNLERYWGPGTGNVYPYAGKSMVNRGASAGETNAPQPLGVRDLQLHPPNNLHDVVAAFRVPSDGTYTVSNLGVRRVHNLGGPVGFHVFNAQQVEIATLSATANQAWVTSPTTYTLPNLLAGASIYFAVDRAGDYAYDATEIAWTVTATGGPPPPPSVWNSWEVVTQSGSPQGQVTAAATGATATLEFYESTNNGGVLKGALFGVFTAGVHPGAFNNLERYWAAGTGNVYPYAGRSTLNRGSGVGETNAPQPLGVRDLQLHPPNNLHDVVAAFRVPADGTYTVSNLGVRRVHNLGGPVGFHVFSPQQVEIATLSATANQAWVVTPTTYTLPNLTAGASLYFAVDRAGDYAYDATEIAWTITRTGP